MIIDSIFASYVKKSKEKLTQLEEAMDMQLNAMHDDEQIVIEIM